MRLHLLFLMVAACGIDTAPVNPPPFDHTACEFWDKEGMLLDLDAPYYCRPADSRRVIGPVRLRREHRSTVLTPMVVEVLGNQCVVTDCGTEIIRGE